MVVVSRRAADVPQAAKTSIFSNLQRSVIGRRKSCCESELKGAKKTNPRSTTQLLTLRGTTATYPGGCRGHANCRDSQKLDKMSASILPKAARPVRQLSPSQICRHQRLKGCANRSAPAVAYSVASRASGRPSSKPRTQSPVTPPRVGPQVTPSFLTAADTRYSRSISTPRAGYSPLRGIRTAP